MASVSAFAALTGVPSVSCPRAPSAAPAVTRAYAQGAGQDEASMAILHRTNEEHDMPGNTREMVTMAERTYPVRVRIAVPPGGLGRRLTQMTAWLDENCGADGWAMTPSETRGVLNDAVLPRRYRRERLCCAVVCRLQGRDGGGRCAGWASSTTKFLG